MNWSLWWAFITTSLVLDMMPGPAVMLVLGTSVRHGWPPAVRTILGILSANAFYFALSATSLGALLIASYRIFFLVKWIGAAYLLYLGWKTIRSRTILTDRSEAAPGRLFATGVLSQLANPKAVVYFAAILPQFLDPAFPVVPQLIVLGGSNTVTEFFVLLTYAIVAGRATLVLREPRYAAWASRIAGVILIAAGGWMALLDR